MFGEESTRNLLIEGTDCFIALFNAHQLGRLKREARIDVALGWIDLKPDFLSQTLKPRANLRPLVRRKWFRCSFGRRLRVDFERKPTQISLELSRRFFGPDRAEVTKRSDYVRPDVDDTLHNRDQPTTDYIPRDKHGDN